MRITSMLATCLAAGFALSACSSDDNPSGTKPSQGGAQIRFNVVAAATPRVAHVETTTSSINSFLVNAFTEKKPFMTNVTVQREGETSNWTYHPLAYWPASAVNFYAVSPDIRNTVRDNGTDKWVMSYDNEGNTDLLYAVTAEMSQSNPTAPQPVQMNFRHALSRIAILMSSTNSQIRVHVNSIELENIFSTGDFRFPEETTAPDSAVTGSWSNQSSSGDEDIFELPEMGTVLTETPTELSNQNFHFALPQTLTPVSETANNFSGSYIKIKCRIFNPAGTLLWPNAKTPAENKDGEFGLVRYPLCLANQTMSWDAGKAYIYNITINDLPGLAGIDFTVTVDKINYDAD